MAAASESGSSGDSVVCTPCPPAAAPPLLWSALPYNGRAVQVDPMKPKLKPPGTKLSKLNGDIMLLTSAFKFNSRR
jgi:hypothetical protein